MSRDYTRLSDEKLVELYQKTRVEVGETDIDDPKHGDLVVESGRIAAALKSRGDNSLAKLLPLLDDQSASVRIETAHNCLDLARDRCIAVIQSLLFDNNRYVAALAGLYLIQNAPALARQVVGKTS